MSKVTYNVIYQVCGQVTADIPDDITTREEAITEGQSWMLPDLSVQRKTTNGPI